VAERHWLSDENVAISIVLVVMLVRATDASGFNRDLQLARTWRIYRAVFLFLAVKFD
jgi:hypothetical protein